MQSDVAHSAHSIHFRVTFIVVTRYMPPRVDKKVAEIEERASNAFSFSPKPGSPSLSLGWSYLIIFSLLSPHFFDRSSNVFI